MTKTNEAPQFQYIFPSSGAYYLVVDAIPDECGDFELAVSFRGTLRELVKVPRGSVCNSQQCLTRVTLQ